MTQNRATQNPHRPILLVEDNPLDVDLTIRAFRKQNLLNPIEVARDGEEAIAWLEKWDSGEPLPLIILMDLKLPKVGGLEVIHQFKNHPVSQSVPVIVLTSSSEDQDINTAYKHGANSYMVKPVNFDNFSTLTTEIERYWFSTTELPR